VAKRNGEAEDAAVAAGTDPAHASREAIGSGGGLPRH